MKYKTGDVIYTASNSLISKIIRKVTGCKYSHTALIILNNQVLEAQKNGIINIPLDEYTIYNNKYHTTDVYRPNFVFDKDKLMFEASKGEHIKYDILALIKHMIKKYFGVWRFRKNTYNKKYTCSEFVAYTFYKASKGEQFHNFYKISPADLYNSGKFDYIGKL